GYFDETAVKVLAEFERTALAARREEQLVSFPEALERTLQNTWQSSATCIYRNWLQYVLAKKAEESAFTPVTGSYGPIERKRSAVL
ncbi:MAG: hypothetical protein WA437_16840, partial [Candidatus Sulfotelmatobacter sp.]